MGGIGVNRKKWTLLRNIHCVYVCMCVFVCVKMHFDKLYQIYPNIKLKSPTTQTIEIYDIS